MSCCESCRRGGECEADCAGEPSPAPVVGARDIDAVMRQGEREFVGAGWGPLQGLADSMRTPGHGGALGAVDRAIDPVVDAVLPAIPVVGPAVQSLHRTRMEGLYGSSQGSPAQAPAESKQALIKRMQALYRRKRSGDAAARAEVVALKERAATDNRAASEWQVYRAVALDDAARVERRAPIVGAFAPPGALARLKRQSGGASPSAVSEGGRYHPAPRPPVAPVYRYQGPRYQGSGYVRGRSDTPHTDLQRETPTVSDAPVSTNPATGKRRDD